ncbi:hypothetical protein GLIP_2381 [Aliiglaciecola lipolytica E3]|uniref:Uncharacterized protein n=1 Tax=Aliiglaciecola lipolytica E3 TaxID=1127673 RepID=K6Y9Z8_9ALTE|nr:hypothetical protein GLIP_2381 [Aliiglaciecola lipolytica E3]
MTRQHKISSVMSTEYATRFDYDIAFPNLLMFCLNGETTS